MWRSIRRVGLWGAPAVFALGATRFPPATEIQLLTLLHSRAEAHKL